MSFTSILNKLFGNKSQRDLKEIQPIVDQINALGPKMKELTNDELRRYHNQYQKGICQGNRGRYHRNRRDKVKNRRPAL